MVVDKKDTLKNETIPTVNDTVKVVNNDAITPPVNNKNKNTTNTKTDNSKILSPQKGKSYIIIASLPTQETAEKEKNRFAQMGVESQIVLASNNRYRLTIGVFNTTKEAVEAYEKFHGTHQNIHPWLWEN
jgi:cell division protein FtsN